MEMHQIRYFLVAAETLNFTRAAEQCNVSQPALTRAIQQLEHELGGPLFRRERRHTHLTDLGKLMRDHLVTLQEQARAAKEAAHRLLNLEKAPLSLGVMCTVGPQRLMGFLARFQAENPGVEVTLHETTPNKLTERLLAGELDVAVLGLPTELHERFDTKLLFRERMVITFAPGHRFESMKRVRFSDLTGENYLDRLSCEFRSSFFTILSDGGIELKVSYRSEREDWIQQMVLAGMGVCLMPEHSIAQPGLLFRPIIEPELSRDVQLVTVAGRQYSPALKSFVREARAHPWLT
ncbi:MAG: LysR family transcriptional regulator [Alphaproteobacteria bacterium]